MHRESLVCLLISFWRVKPIIIPIRISNDPLSFLTLIESMMAEELAWIIKYVLFNIDETLGNREKLTIASECLLLEQVRLFLLVRVRLTSSSLASNFVLKSADKLLTWLDNSVVVRRGVLLGWLWPVFVGVDFSFRQFLAKSFRWIFNPFVGIAVRSWNTMKRRGLGSSGLRFIFQW